MTTEERKEAIYHQVMEGRLEGGIAVVEADRAPVVGMEYYTQLFYIGLCLKGGNLGQYDYRDTDFHAGDICWILPDHVLSHHYVSPDYTVLSLFITRDYFHRLRQMGVLAKYFYRSLMPILSLSPGEFDTMHATLRMIGLLAESDVPQRDELIAQQLRILSTLGTEYIRRHTTDLPQPLLHDELFERFYEAIIHHHRQSREVKFYADLLALTPKYFATVIKRTTGLAASEWINRYVMVEAKWLLRTERQKSIQQIAHHLGFTEQASFSRFFKGYEGLSPRDFREHV